MPLPARWSKRSFSRPLKNGLREGSKGPSPRRFPRTGESDAPSARPEGEPRDGAAVNDGSESGSLFPTTTDGEVKNGHPDNRWFWLYRRFLGP